MRQAHTIHTHTDSCNVGDAVVVTGAVGAAVVDDALELVGVLVVGDAVVGDAVVGTADVGDADVGDGVVGTAVVGAFVGESVTQQVHMRLLSHPGAAVHDTPVGDASDWAVSW